ncbi:hypothetical protein FHT70_003704 [Rhizobium sp. BK049]|nr:hypothetical protein [Rhizobium sp. BK049]
MTDLGPGAVVGLSALKRELDAGGHKEGCGLMEVEVAWALALTFC